MCGIVGVCDLTDPSRIDQSLIERMLGLIRHRGPDEFGIYLDGAIGMGSARLSIIDLTTGSQPISNEDGTIWIVYNGEVFNYLELRADLEARGHRFATASDTEVIVHLYEERGPRCVDLLNGQFAFAIWDRSPGNARLQSGFPCPSQAGTWRSGGILFLARDRVGIRPLYYARADGQLVFASEIKALLAHPALHARLDPVALAQVFTLWTTLAPRTPFEGIFELPPGHTLIARDGKLTVEAYWSLDFPNDDAAFRAGERTLDDYAAGLRDLLADATRLRLRADVPVGAYLSGGLDSSTIAALIRGETVNHLETFSIAFADPAFDEREPQERMVAVLGTDHHRIECAEADIGRVFPDVIWHAEWPLLRTSPAPMYLLSGLVRGHGLKVVLTGEGADEFLGGYNIYKEDKLRRFWARVPDSALRPLLLRRLYPYVQGLGGGDAYLEAFFRRGLTDTERLDYSHIIRWANGAALRRLFSAQTVDALASNDSDGHEPGRIYDPAAEAVARLAAHPAYARWSPLARAQYAEVTMFMSEYLLSSQGDRMLSAHSVEGRFPFLDHRVIEYAARIPPRFKILGLREKHVLKRAMRDTVPDFVRQRVKRPYRAPIQRAFFGPDAPDYVAELLSPEAFRASGYFDPAAVAALLRKAGAGRPLGERDNMALAGVLSTQLLHHQFVAHFDARNVPPIAPTKVCVGSTAQLIPATVGRHPYADSPGDA
jgi:asparagine synthase (glutamine-hydrolysing)